MVKKEEAYTYAIQILDYSGIRISTVFISLQGHPDGNFQQVLHILRRSREDDAEDERRSDPEMPDSLQERVPKHWKSFHTNGTGYPTGRRSE